MNRQLTLMAGFLCLLLGAVGTCLPFLPTVPFLLAASICFAKTSTKLHSWFIQTRLYKNNLESWAQGKGMTKKAKFRVISVLSLTMAFGFLMMKNVPIARIILVFVWIFHVLYFVYGIKTLHEINE